MKDNSKVAPSFQFYCFCFFLHFKCPVDEGFVTVITKNYCLFFFVIFTIKAGLFKQFLSQQMFRPDISLVSKCLK